MIDDRKKERETSGIMTYYHLPLALALLAILSATPASANDSSYYASGNQIIPLQETDISVKKEVLTIKRINDDDVRVTVDYTFHNPGKEKTILMGFEAGSPSGDANTNPLDGKHPYIKNFSIEINKVKIPHKVSFFLQDNQKLDNNQSLYTVEDLKKDMPPRAKEIQETPYDINVVNEFFYVYHFPATFPMGDTSVIHTYDYAISSSVFISTSIDYLLTPALRWANKQIDDFTLIIDLGALQQYHISPDFFETTDSWTTQGRVKIGMEEVMHEQTTETSRAMTVWQHQGSVTFHAKNFKPKGELSLFANYTLNREEILDSKTIKISLQDLPMIGEMNLKDEFTRKVLENIPYARRGYVFKNAELKAFFEGQPWYMPDPDYKEVALTEEEKTWLKEVRELKIGK